MSPPEQDCGPSTYLVRREHHSSETEAPWVGLSFALRLGSDPLAEALKRVYPDLSTLRQRKHQAIIDLLQKELQRFKDEDLGIVHPNLQVDWSSGNTPRSDSRELASTSHSVYSPSPSLSSPRPVNGSQLSVSQSSPLPIRPPSPNTQGHHFVFSASDGRTMQVKTKRRMTNSERKDYKQTRERGACDECRKKKGKCTHNVGKLGEGLEGQMPSQAAKKRKPGHDRIPSVDTKLLKSEGDQDVHSRSPELPHSGKRSQSHHSAIPAHPAVAARETFETWSPRGGSSETQTVQMYVQPDTCQSEHPHLRTSSLEWGPSSGLGPEFSNHGVPAQSSASRPFVSFNGAPNNYTYISDTLPQPEYVDPWMLSQVERSNAG